MTNETGPGRQTILIVDDNPVNLGVVVDHLEQAGYDVLVALGGLEALDRVRFADPDLILLDVMMPDMNGFDVCRNLHGDPQYRDIPVIFMTALADVQDKVTAFAAGGVDFVSKPFQVEELLARVQTHLALRKATADLEARSRALEAEVEARRSAERLLRESEIRHRRLFESAGDAILVIDCADATVVDANEKCAELLGLSRDRGALPFADLACFSERLSAQEVLAALREERQMKWPEWSWRRSDGEPVHAEVIGNTYEAGGRLLAQCTLRDIRVRKEAEARVRYLALHDSLTGLPNRTMLMDRLQQAIGHARSHHEQIGLLLLDLDHFKHINDSLGHFIGDELLEQVARRLRSVLTEGDIAARLGGDEFVVVATGVRGPHDAEQLARRISDNLLEPFFVQGRRLHAGASIGICLYPGDGDSPAALLQAADTAMYQAKKRGRGNHRLFSADLSMAADRWHTLSNDLHGACERNEFVLHYQPQISVETGGVIGLETLLRWHHPVQGLIAPGLFIPLLEEHGKMVEVGRWVLKQACLQNAAWQAQGHPPVRIGVNLSAQQFYRGDIVLAVREALLESGLAAEWLELELTESLTLDDTEATLRIMRELKALGVMLSLDDFGTGWSALGYLSRFPLDRIKIDRSFVRDLINDSSTAAIVNSILDLARQLNLDCVAEGVETAAQLEHLRLNRCPSIQGFFFSQGVEMQNIPALLRGTIPTAPLLDTLPQQRCA
ncbi:putative bifunctional diguanylate cyclase/phosphodiesterase [Croceicoccus marinus]|uniref:EAL domain-containing protein n=1 Tax=Croceicoccus marinus TaxID=450378 RepID=A0A7G6VW56_9SPHN|nr:EAL domain-containing protein [Croceicoccus marinus]QNE05971.1 EAL domain-containing protein [Croceicoccus marinus]